MRPWGHISWALALSSPRQYRFVGCLGPEERSLATYFFLQRRGALTGDTLLRIEEPASPNAVATTARLQTRSDECARLGMTPNVYRMNLLDSVFDLESIVLDGASSVILDITSLPKRFFFFALKLLLQASHVRNLVLTYAVPKSYATTALSEDNDPWDALPTFRQPDLAKEAEAHKRIIVNVGFMPEGFVAHLESPTEQKIDLLVPFPSPLPAVRRAWQSVWRLSATTSASARFDEHRVSATDMSEAFDRIVSLIPSGTRLASFAPFGPKPISAAMCIYATLTGSPVYYSQPKVYHPDYSLGVAEKAGIPEIYGYWVKHDGVALYSV